MKHFNRFYFIIFICISGCITMLWEKPDRTNDLWQAESMLFGGNYRNSEDYKNYDKALKVLNEIYKDNEGYYREFYIKPYTLYLIGCIYLKYAEVSSPSDNYSKAKLNFTYALNLIESKGSENLYFLIKQSPYYMSSSDSESFTYKKEELLALIHGQKAYAELRLNELENSLEDLQYCVENYPLKKDYPSYEEHYRFSKYYNKKYDQDWNHYNQLFFDKHPYYYLAYIQYNLGKNDEALEYLNVLLTHVGYYSHEKENKEYEQARELFGEVFLLSGDIRTKLNLKFSSCEDYKKALEFGNNTAVDRLKENNCIHNK